MVDEARPSTRSSIAKRAASLAWGCVLAIVVLVPVITTNPTILGIGTHPLTVDQVELPKAVALAVLSWLGLAAWSVSEASAPRGVRWSRTWWLLIGFVALAGVSAVLSPHQQIAYVGRWFHYEGLLQIGAYAAACFVAAQTVSERRLASLIRTGAVTGAVLACYGIAQALRLDPANWLSVTFPLERSFATWNNPDFFGGYLIFPLAFAIAITFGDSDRRWRIAGGVAAALVSAAMVATLTRGAWLAGVLLAGLMLAGLARRGFGWKRPLLGVVILLVAVVAVVGIVNGPAMIERAVGAFSIEDIGVGGRIDIWRATAPFALDRPLFGSGPDTFQVTSMGNLAGRPNPAPDDPHNIVIYLLVTVGLPAAVAAVGFVVVALARSARRAFSREREPATIALSAIWCATLVHGLYLSIGVSIAASTTILFVCVGLLLASNSKRVRIPLAGVSAIAVIAIGLVVVSAWLGARGLAADNAYFRARTAIREGGDRVGWAERAVELNPLNGNYLRELYAARAAQE